MKKLNFTCPHCGGHKLIGAKPLQWIQLDAIGFDDDGDLLFDHDRPSIVDDNYDFEIYCENCYVKFSLGSIMERTQNNAVLYTYNMRRRPLDFGTAPDGWVDYLPDKSRWGWIVYPRQLSADEIYEYELEPVSSNSEEK